MTGHGQKFSRNKERAISALLSQPSVALAAEFVGIGERTLWRWLQLDDFKTAYREARSQLVSQAIALVQSGMSSAVRTLQDIMSDKDAPASARVSAAKTMLDMGLKGIEIEDLEFRISQLENSITR
jgi:hypothetical protein